MAEFTIIGGGIGGLLVAKSLQNQGKTFNGFESQGHLGGRTLVGHHRIYEEKSKEVLNQYLSGLEWTQVSDKALTLKKGTEWTEVVSWDVETREEFYLRSNFHHPKDSFTNLIRSLQKEVGEGFQLNHSLSKIFPATKELEFQDGMKINYEKIIWCAPLYKLGRAWMGDKKPIAKFLKHAEELSGGINLDLELSSNPFPSENSILFQFRFKDKQLKAIGIIDTWTDADEKRSMHWMVFLEQKLVEDHEEVAKVVRTLKRELYKTFPDLKSAVLGEKIVFLPQISGEKPSRILDMKILPDVYYVGPELELSVNTTPLQNLDLTLENCDALQRELSSS